MDMGTNHHELVLNWAGGARTHDPRINSAMLLPAELPPINKIKGKPRREYTLECFISFILYKYYNINFLKNQMIF